ncbi:MAG: phenylalanine--tRNA ligase subunit beta [Alphaproteobacteria bacterium]
MKLTLGWLRDHLDTEASLDTIARTLTLIGLEVDGIADRGKDLAPFTVARVLKAEQHPDADRLRVCLVDTGREEIQVVCGAPNARAGMMAVFAPSGTVIPATGLELRKSVIRGVESDGMLVSEREMGLSEEHEGIIELDADAPLGAPFARMLGLDDPVVEIGLTPNRGDCAGVRGIARDLAAAGLGDLKPFHGWNERVPGAFASPVAVRLDFPAAAADACPMFVGRYFRGVRNGPSPRWLQDRLKAVGLRPISALVDITNYFSMDLARPLHVFDADKLTGDVTPRLARDGETMLALDGREYTLDAEMTVIADAAGPQALGGLMGAEPTGCTEATTNVFLEVALFDPLRTAMTGRKLGIHSDARYRFERGVDPMAVLPAMEAATRLILELCGGEASEPVVAGAPPEWRRSLTLRPARVGELGGVDVSPEDCRRVLRALGCAVGDGADGRLVVEPPSWRPDIEGEADLVEEVLRIVGYEFIPATPLSLDTVLPARALGPEQERSVRARRALAARGMVEAVTFSFMRSAEAVLFGGGRPDLALANPISADLDMMRPSILPNLVAAARRNADRGVADGALFEVGPQYGGIAPGDQRLVAAGLRWGRSGPRHWATSPRAVDAFDAKADAAVALEAAGAPVANLQVSSDAPAWYHPGRSGALRLGPKVMATFGELHPAALAALGLDGRAVGFEVFLDAVPQPKARGGKARPLLRVSPFQSVERDFAFVVDADVPAEAIAKAVRGADKALIADVGVFDIYAGPTLGEGRKSVAVAVTLQPQRATLTEAEIEAVSQSVVAAVEKATGGTLRR